MEVVLVRYWAAARSAAGTPAEEIEVAGPVTLADLRSEVVRRHADSRLADVIGVCSVLLGDQPVSTQDPATVEIAPGSTVEFLPPFAGG